jgi:HAT1-interacting factor 1
MASSGSKAAGKMPVDQVRFFLFTQTNNHKIPLHLEEEKQAQPSFRSLPLPPVVAMRGVRCVHTRVSSRPSLRASCVGGKMMRRSFPTINFSFCFFPPPPRLKKQISLALSRSSQQNALLSEATESYDAGCAAIKAGDMDEAITRLARALEVRTEVYGDEALECASSYYKYGCALFYKAQDENTVFGKQVQAAADAKDGAAKAAAAADDDSDGEDCDDDDEDEEGAAAAAGGSKGKGAAGGDDDEDDDEDDMELAWKLIENARLCYEEDGEHPIELANVYETLGEINTEHANFEAALEDLTKCLAILDAELDEDDRRIAGVLCSMSVAYQLLDEPEKALKGCTRAIDICSARIARLKSSDAEAIAAVSASGAPGGGGGGGGGGEVLLATAKAELEQIEAGLADLKAREEELKGLVNEDETTREQIKKAFAAIGGMGGGGGAGSSAAGAAAGGAITAPVESTGFAAPQLAAGAAAPVNLGVVGRSAGASRVTPANAAAASAATGGNAAGKKEPKRIVMVPQAAAPAAAGSAAAAAAAAFGALPPARRSLEDMMGGGGDEVGAVHVESR